MSKLIDSEMKVGFTGSRAGMTKEQIATVNNLLIDDVKEFHHGDCIGADTQAHSLAHSPGTRIIVHPPEDSALRGYCVSANVREKKSYLERNHNIVDETDILIACPGTTKEVRRSGTWTTIRYAEKQKKTILLIYPSGRIFKIEEGFGRKS